MWLLMVTTLSSAVLADAGYLYNAPSVHSRLPYNQPAIFHPLHNSQPHDVKIVQGIQEEDKSISYSVSYKDYIYLKKDNIDNNNAHFHQSSPNYNNVQVHGNTGYAASNGGILASQNIQSNIGHLNNGYGSYAQSLTPPVNMNSNYAPVLPATSVQSYYHTATPTMVGTNIGFAQSSPANNNPHTGYAQTNHLSTDGSYSNSYAPSSPASVNQYSGYVQTTPTDVNNYNSYPQISAPFAPAGNLNNVYAQNLIPIGTNNLNNGYVHSAPAAGSYNGYAQALTPQAHAPLNNGYSQPAHASISLNSGYSQATQTNAPVNNGYNQAVPASAPSNNGYSQAASSTVGTNTNSGYPHSFTSSPNFGLNNAYAQTVSSTGSAIPNTGYAQTSSSSAGTNLNDGNEALTPTGSANLDTGYGLPSTSSGANVNNAVVSAPSSIGYSQAASSTVGTNTKSGYPHSFTSSPNFGLNNAYAQTVSSTGNAILNTGYAQTSSSSAGTNLNDGNEALIPTGSANLDTGYGLPSLSSGANANNAVAPSVLTTASGSSSTSYSQASTGPTHVDLNSGIAQLSSSVIFDNSFTQTLTSASDSLNTPVNPSIVSTSSSPPVIPIVHKHIYFHVPPPDIEETVKVSPPPPPPKKNYKILFIKVPSQDSKTNIVRLQQQIAQMQNAPVEDKTLIYVLVKNPEEPKPVILPKPKPSEHQVFFVKYNGSPFDIASQVSDELDKTGTVKSIVPLEPGLVNGQHK